MKLSCAVSQWTHRIRELCARHICSGPVSRAQSMGYRRCVTLFSFRLIIRVHSTVQLRSGQEEFDRLRSLSYAETHVVMLCFSVSLFASLPSQERIKHDTRLHFSGGQSCLTRQRRSEGQICLHRFTPSRSDSKANSGLKRSWNFALGWK